MFHNKQNNLCRLPLVHALAQVSSFEDATTLIVLEKKLHPISTCFIGFSQKKGFVKRLEQPFHKSNY